MKDEPLAIKGKDVPLELLQPLKLRYTELKKMRGYKRIFASVKVLGLIEPLCVFPENGKFIILDGFLRMKACEQLGVKNVPCLIYPDKEAYTYNKMVNKLSPVQENRMIRKALDTLDRNTITKTLGMSKLECRLTDKVLKALHPDIIVALEKGGLSKNSAAELVHVKEKRQCEIFKEMKQNGDFSIRFIRALILRTPEELRSGWKCRVSPWKKDSKQKKDLVTKLQEAEQRNDFYSRLYRDYTSDVMKLTIYMRSLITNEDIGPLISRKHPDVAERLNGIIFKSEVS